MFTTLMDFNRTFRAFDELRKRMDRVFDDFERGSVVDYGNGLRVDVYDDGESYVLTADVPGLRQEDIQVTLNQNTITVKGERNITVPEGYSVHRRERPKMTFSRSVALPTDIDADKTHANLKNGVLMLKIPKAPAALPKRIEVKSA